MPLPARPPRTAPPRLRLARLPTPLEEFPRLQQAWGGPRIWMKRDDLAGFGLSGNKVRKLEFHLAAAQEAGAAAVITCGAVQSNHCRATAVACARLGFEARLLLRSPDGRPPARSTANLAIDRLAGASIRYLTPEEYRDRDALMAAEAEDTAASGRPAWVIPEGASDALGMLGMALGYEELAGQIRGRLEGRAAGVWHAGSSGGTTAGFGWASDRTGPPIPLIAVGVSDQAEVLAGSVERIWADGAAAFGGEAPSPDIEYLDRYLGGGYGAVSGEQAEVQAEAARLTGLLFDPVYTGKALYALRREIAAGRYDSCDQVIFWHTGGGFAAVEG